MKLRVKLQIKFGKRRSKNWYPAYQIRIIENVKIQPSPQWLQNLLMNEGIRPINNVVDVTNYILLLFGQPFHAFDYDKLGSEEIVVRHAKDKETMVTLDGETRHLTSEDWSSQMEKNQLL